MYFITGYSILLRNGHLDLIYAVNNNTILTCSLVICMSSLILICIPAIPLPRIPRGCHVLLNVNGILSTYFWTFIAILCNHVFQISIIFPKNITSLVTTVACLHWKDISISCLLSILFNSLFCHPLARYIVITHHCYHLLFFLHWKDV